MHLHPEPLPAPAVLRELLPAALSATLGEVRVLISALPLEGAPMLLLDGAGLPVLVSVDAQDGGRAVLNGLAAVETLQANDALWLGLIPEAGELENLDNLCLQVLVPELPPGADWLENSAERLSIGRLRAIRVNGEMGLMVEPAKPPKGSLTEAAECVLPRFRTGRVTLSDEEHAFFD